MGNRLFCSEIFLENLFVLTVNDLIRTYQKKLLIINSSPLCKSPQIFVKSFEISFNELKNETKIKNEKT